MIRPTSHRPRRHGMVAIAIIIVLVIVQVMIVGLVISGSRDQHLTIQRADTVEAFYAAEAGVNMAIREVVQGADEDGDCSVGSISHDGQDNNNVTLGGASFLVASTTVGTQTTVTSYAVAGGARRQISAVVDVAAAP